jgi:hypothetical protein
MVLSKTFCTGPFQNYCHRLSGKFDPKIPLNCSQRSERSGSELKKLLIVCFNIRQLQNCPFQHNPFHGLIKKLLFHYIFTAVGQLLIAVFAGRFQYHCHPPTYLVISYNLCWSFLMSTIHQFGIAKLERSVVD